MKNINLNKKQIILVVGLILVAGVAIFASTNANLFQGNLRMPNQPGGTMAAILVDNYSFEGNFASDPDFDGVFLPQDKCADFPAYQIVRFGPKDYMTYSGQKVQLDNVGADENGMVMNFKVGGKTYKAYINDPGTEPTHVPGLGASQGFTIRGLFGSNSPQNEAIVMLSGDAKVDPNTGCALKPLQQAPLQLQQQKPQQLQQNNQVNLNLKSKSDILQKY